MAKILKVLPKTVTGWHLNGIVNRRNGKIQSIDGKVRAERVKSGIALVEESLVLKKRRGFHLCILRSHDKLVKQGVL